MTMKNVKPLGNAVRVRLLEQPKESDVIITLDPAKHLHPNRDAIVTAVGPGKILPNGKRWPMTVKVGDKVQINGICGTDGKHEGKYVTSDEILITENDIYLIYDD